MYPCNSRMRRPTGLMWVYLPLDSTIAKQILPLVFKASLSIRPQRSHPTLSVEPTRKSMKEDCMHHWGIEEELSSVSLRSHLGCNAVYVQHMCIVMLSFKTPSNIYLHYLFFHLDTTRMIIDICSNADFFFLYLPPAVLLHAYIHLLSAMRLMELCTLSIRLIELVVDHLFLNLFPLFSPIKNGVIYCDINHINKAD